MNEWMYDKYEFIKGQFREKDKQEQNSQFMLALNPINCGAYKKSLKYISEAFRGNSLVVQSFTRILQDSWAGVKNGLIRDSPEHVSKSSLVITIHKIFISTVPTQ